MSLFLRVFCLNGQEQPQTHTAVAVVPENNFNPIPNRCSLPKLLHGVGLDGILNRLSRSLVTARLPAAGCRSAPVAAIDEIPIPDRAGAHGLIGDN
ncbi:MAG: hypothetical protein JSU00_12475 [Acidobacteria bacterium]|nr:hypothetical protein [Acidobacteriota bacterium]